MTILIVFNARSGQLNSILDSAHKLLSPSTYSCHLCALTHDAFSINKSWKSFVSNAKAEMKFFHKDEFEKAFGNQGFEFPVILKKDKNGLQPLATRDELQSLESTEALIEFLNSQIEINSKGNL